MSGYRERGLLAEFAANEVGWAQVLDKLERARETYTRQAAEAESHEVHLDFRGRKRGIEQALTLIHEARRECRAQSQEAAA